VGATSVCDNLPPLEWKVRYPGSAGRIMLQAYVLNPLEVDYD